MFGASVFFGFVGALVVGNLRDDQREWKGTAGRAVWMPLLFALSFAVCAYHVYYTGAPHPYWVCAGFAGWTCLFASLENSVAMRGPGQVINWSDLDRIQKISLRLWKVLPPIRVGGSRVMGLPAWLTWGIIRYGSFGLAAIPLSPWPLRVDTFAWPILFSGLAWFAAYPLARWLVLSGKLPAPIMNFIAAQSSPRNETAVAGGFLGGLLLFGALGL